MAMTRSLYVLGIMTGTSCDGADFALVEFRSPSTGWTGSTERLKAMASTPFPRELRTRLRTAQKGQFNIPESALLTRDYSRWIAKASSSFLKSVRAPLNRTLLSVHGQTVWHDPSRAISVQLLDSAILSAATGCTVASAFRQPDLARGGQGAPLVPYYHWLRATQDRRFARQLPIAIHNIGGIANLTYVTPQSSKLIAFDTGPGNALIDLAVEQTTGGTRLFDAHGAIAGSAINRIDWPSIYRLGTSPYFKQRPPKSTGRELFNETFLRRLPGRGPALVANATAFAAHTMALGYARWVPCSTPSRLRQIYLAGGGAQNRVLVELFRGELQRLVGRPVPISALPPEFAPPQYLEAIAFARLGLQAIQGKPVSLAAVTGAAEDAFGAGLFPGANFAGLAKIVLLK